MTYTIADIDNLVEEVGWDYSYFPYLGNGKRAEAEVTERQTGWLDFYDHISVSRRRWSDDVKAYVDIPEGEVEYKFFDGFGTFKKLDEFGGEGQGDDYWFVFSITDAEDNVRIFKRHGWYASFDGGYYEGPTVEVRAAEETITVWEAV